MKTFHKHEVYSRDIARTRLKAWGLSDSGLAKVDTLIRFHQIRFYKTTKEPTLRKFIRNLGIQNIPSLFALLIADRMGNLANRHKPVFTFINQKLYIQLLDLSKKVITLKDLDIKLSEIKSIAGSNTKLAIANLIGLVQTQPSRNKYLYLKDFLERNYEHTDENA